jgi:hypothetical protein
LAYGKKGLAALKANAKKGEKTSESMTPATQPVSANGKGRDERNHEA